MNPLTGNSLLKSSKIYGYFLEQREELMKMKWLLSEQAGHDVGFDYALIHWITHHHSKWRKSKDI